MATPASLPNPARDAQDLPNGSIKEAYEQGHDADRKVPEESFSQDPEKGVDSHAHSTHTDERTLSGDVPPEQERDPNIVDWDGPDDPKTPRTGRLERNGVSSQLSVHALSLHHSRPPSSHPAYHKYSVLSNETSNIMASFVVSVYILGFAIGPLIIAPMSELYGRMHLYNICNVLFVIFNICCAVSNSMGMLVAFRFFAGCAGAAPLTIGGGTIADMFPPQQRAGAMAIWAVGPLLGPVIGPVCGGFLVEHQSWRWVFWILAIFGGVFGVLLFFVGRESFHPTLLARKTKALQKETGNMNLRSKLAQDLPPREIFIRAIVYVR
ncbi:unnamed protein product [Alternaria alternata]